ALLLPYLSSPKKWRAFATAFRARTTGSHGNQFRGRTLIYRRCIMSAALKSQSVLVLMCALGIAAFPPPGSGQSVAAGDTASAAAVEATARTAGAHKNTAPALNEAQRHQVGQGVMARPTDDKLPAGFEPAVGTKVPAQKKLP